jgi:hypothetical protein
MGPESIWLIAIGGTAALICNILYMVGGTGFDGKGYKWMRRFLGAGILASAANGIAIYMHVWSWMYLIMFATLAAGFSLGYGADTVPKKVFLRTVCAIGVLSTCIVGYYAAGATATGLAVCIMAGIVGAASICMGVWNPFNNAPLEQFLICQVLTMFVPWWAFVR